MNSPAQATRFPITAGFLMALGLGAALGFGLMLGEWLTGGLLMLVVMGACRGYCRGGLRIAGTVLGMIVAVQFAEPCAQLIAPICERWTGFAAEYQGVLQLATAGFLLAVIVVVVFRLLARVMFRSRPGWQRADCWLGALLGGAQGGLLGLILLFGIVILEPLVRPYVSGSNPSVQLVASQVIALNDQARQSTLQPVVEAMQPMQVRVQRRARDVAQTVRSGGQPNVTVLFRSMRGDE